MEFNTKQKDILESLVDATLESVNDSYDDFYEWDALNGRSQFTVVVNMLHKVYGESFIQLFKTSGLNFSGYYENYYMYTLIGREVNFKSWKKMLELTHGTKK